MNLFYYLNYFLKHERIMEVLDQIFLDRLRWLPWFYITSTSIQESPPPHKASTYPFKQFYRYETNVFLHSRVTTIFPKEKYIDQNTPKFPI